MSTLNTLLPESMLPEVSQYIYSNFLSTSTQMMVEF